jgi:hypothetical protein
MTQLYTVYRTTNTVTGRFYIGVHKTNNPLDDYLGSGLALKEAIKKYGRKTFTKEVLFSFEHRDDAYAKEKELVTKVLIESGQVYNIATGGVPSIDWGNRRKATALRGEEHPQWGKKLTEEERRQRSETLKRTYAEKPRDPSTWEKGAAKRRGVPSPVKGRPQSEESNRKRALAHLSLQKKTCHCGRSISPSNWLRHLAIHSV